MNSNDHLEREAAISRELKSLPELTAPASIASRVMTAIEERAAVPWHRRSWGTWPASWQAASLAALLAVFGGLCFGGWELSQTAAAARGAQGAGRLFSNIESIRNIFSVLASSTLIVIHKLGAGFMIACLFMFGMAYTLILSLGTACFRLTHAKHQTSNL